MTARRLPTLFAVGLVEAARPPEPDEPATTAAAGREAAALREVARLPIEAGDLRWVASQRDVVLPEATN